MLTFFSAYSHGVNLIMEAGGVLPAIVVTALGMIISNKFFSDQTWK